MSIYQDPHVIKRAARRSYFVHITSNGTLAAAVMVIAALLAVGAANSPLYEPLEHFFKSRLSLGVEGFSVGISFEQIVNDLLMSFFFLLVGVELKYEMTVGQLRKPRQAALPMLAAVGGVVMPAAIYLVLNHNVSPQGWATPIATDIAFALGVMSLLGSRISPETKVFFQTLAIADDILAIVVIAAFYGQTPNIAWCAASVVVVVVLFLINQAKIYSVKPYFVAGMVLWICMFNSGIHATLAGVILAFFLPSRSDVRLTDLSTWLTQRASRLEDTYDETHHVLGQHDFTQAAQGVEKVLHHVTPPLQRIENYLSVVVNFLILPLFAFTNAEIHLLDVPLHHLAVDPTALAVYAGAVIGKPIGIIGATWLLVTIGFAKLPTNVNWHQVIAVGIMGGLGFTMSILISGLAFPDHIEMSAAKVAILLGSLTSGVLGCLYVKLTCPLTQRSRTHSPNHEQSQSS